MKPFGNLYDRNKPVSKKSQTPPTWTGNTNAISNSPILSSGFPEETRPTWRVGTNSYYITLEQIVKRHVTQIENLVTQESLQAPGTYSQYLINVLSWLFSINQGRLFIMNHTPAGVQQLWNEIRQNNDVTAFVTRITQDFFLSDLFNDPESINHFIERMQFAVHATTQSATVKENDTRTFGDLIETDLATLYKNNPWFLVVTLMNGMNITGINLS